MAKKADNDRNSRLKGVAHSVAQSETTEMAYLELRGQIYWFRRRAPNPLKPGMRCILGDCDAVVGKNGYVRLSLHTRDKKEASKLSRKFAHHLDMVAERAAKRQAATPPAQPRLTRPQKPLTAEDIQHAADWMYSDLLAADERTAQQGIQRLLTGDVDEEGIREPDRYIWSSADLPPASTQGQADLLKQLAPVISHYVYQATEQKKTIEAITPELLPFADAFRRFVATLERRKASEFEPTPSLPVVLTPWSWDDAIEYYFRQRQGLSDGTKASYRLAWSTLAQIAKSPPAKLTRAVAVKWRDSIAEKLDPKTVQDRLTAATAIWRCSQDNTKIDPAIPDPFKRLRVILDTNKAKSRRGFSDAELSKVFSAPPVETARAVSVHAGYWLPLLALYHGARLEELTGLEVADVSDWEHGLLLHIQENQTRPRLKHRAKSQRQIPVHPTVMKLGFAEYVQAAKAAGVQRLFPSFATGATFGEAFVTHVKALLNPAPKRLVGMHCFRHNWETARRTARLDTSAANYITGRRIDEGSAALYGDAAGPAVLYAELAKLAYRLNHAPAPAITAKELKEQDSNRQRAIRKAKRAGAQ